MKNNLDKKIIALIMSILMWYFIDSSSNIEKEYWLKIKYINLPTHLALVDAPQKAKLIAISTRFRSENIDLNDIYFEISLKSFKAGTYPIELSPNLKIVSNSQMEYKIPNNKINLTLDQKVEKTIEIKPSIINVKGEQIRINQISFFPQKIKVNGPKILLDQLASLPTEDIVVSETGQFELKIRIKNNDDDIKINPQEVYVKIQVIQNQITQEIIIPVQVINLDQKLELKSLLAKTTQLKCTIKSINIKNVDFKDFYSYVDLKEIRKPGIYPMPMIFNKPDYVDDFQLSPALTEVEIVHKEQK
jgi:hypothetical protein